MSQKVIIKVSNKEVINLPYLIIILAFIGLYLTIDGLIELVNRIKLHFIHKQITKLLEEDKNE